MQLEIPFDYLENLLIASNGISFSSDLIRKLVDAEVIVSFIDFTGKPWAKVISASHLSDVELRVEQLKSRQDKRGIALAREFVYVKISGQLGVLQVLQSKPGVEQSALPGLLSGVERVDSSTLEKVRIKLLGLEARAASHYWRVFANILSPENYFPGREKRGSIDPVNVALNYGYGILYSKVWSALYRAHLDPYVGFLHKDRRSRPGLVMDFVEEFRQLVVDYPLVRWLVAHEIEIN